MSNHQDLVLRAERWLRNSKRCGVVLTEYATYAGSIPDAIGFNSSRSFLVECKVSRSDFLRDMKKYHRNNARQMGNFRWYMTLEDLVLPDEVPEGWGLLYVKRNQVREVKVAPDHPEPEVRCVEYSILYSLARRASLRGMIPQLREPLGKNGV